jgi:hypothetical protein
LRQITPFLGKTKPSNHQFESRAIGFAFNFDFCLPQLTFTSWVTLFYFVIRTSKFVFIVSQNPKNQIELDYEACSADNRFETKLQQTGFWLLFGGKK